MPAIPPTSDFNKSTIDKDTFHAKFLALHAYLTGLLASSGNAADARSQLGLGSAATVNTGTAPGNVPTVGTVSATETVAGLSRRSSPSEAVAGVEDTSYMTPLTTAQALSPSKAWTNVTASRALNTVYTNSSGKTRRVQGYALNTSSGVIEGLIGSESMLKLTAASAAPELPFYLEVPSGSTYQINNTGTVSLSKWHERDM